MQYAVGVIFSIFLMLAIFLGESYFGLYFLLPLSLILLVSFKMLLWKKVDNFKIIFGLWLFFLISLLVSGLFSISIPLSLNSWIFYSISFLVFSVFLLSDKQRVVSREIIQYVLIVVLVLSTLSLFFSFSPSLMSDFPGMNLVYSTFGHNHIAALLLLVLPYSWYLGESKFNKTKSFWWLLVPVFLSLQLILSFGRIAILLGFLQILLLMIFKRTHYKLIIFSRMLVAILFFLAIFLGLYFSLSGSFCKVNFLDTKFCKPVSSDSRPRYWRRSIEILKDNMLFGSGPRTYTLSSRKYELTEADSTSFAHNAFLLSFAEQGVLGGMTFLLLMLGMLFFSLKNVKWRDSKNVDLHWMKYIGIGVISIYINVLFDFDWSFLGVFLVTILFLALLMRERTLKDDLKNCVFCSFFKVFYISLSILLAVVSLLFLSVDVFIRMNHGKLAFSVFPYFSWHETVFNSQVDLNESQKSKLLQIYSEHLSMYDTYLFENEGVNTQLDFLYMKKIVELDPQRRMYYDLVEENIQRQEYDQALLEAQKTQVLWKKIEASTDREIGYELKVKLLKQYIELSEYFLLNNEIDKAQQSSFYAYHFWKDQVPQGVEGYLKEKLAIVLVDVANASVSTDARKTSDLYKQARDIQFNSLNNRMWWDVYDVSDISTAQIEGFFEEYIESGEYRQYYGEEVKMKLVLELLSRYLLESNFKDIEALSTRVNDWDSFDYQQRLDYALELEKEIHSLLLANQETKEISENQIGKTSIIWINDEMYERPIEKKRQALLLSKVISRILPGQYWIQLQEQHLEELVNKGSLVINE